MSHEYRQFAPSRPCDRGIACKAAWKFSTAAFDGSLQVSRMTTFPQWNVTVVRSPGIVTPTDVGCAWGSSNLSGGCMGTPPHNHSQYADIHYPSPERIGGQRGAAAEGEQNFLRTGFEGVSQRGLSTGAMWIDVPIRFPLRSASYRVSSVQPAPGVLCQVPCLVVFGV